MKILQRIAFAAVMLLFAGLLARWWLSTAMSESVWTWINGRIEGGQNPGLASDIELLATLAAALLVSVPGTMIIRLLFSRMRNKASGGIS